MKWTERRIKNKDKKSVSGWGEEQRVYSSCLHLNKPACTSVPHLHASMAQNPIQNMQLFQIRQSAARQSQWHAPRQFWSNTNCSFYEMVYVLFSNLFIYNSLTASLSRNLGSFERLISSDLHGMLRIIIAFLFPAWQLKGYNLTLTLMSAPNERGKKKGGKNLIVRGLSKTHPKA